MSTRPDPDLAIAAWLVDEARDGASDRLLAATRQQIESTHQRPSWWPARRLREMNSFAKFAVAAAALAVVAFVGLRLLPGQGSSGALPSPSASPASSASTAPSASPAPSGPVDLPTGLVAAGMYTITLPVGPDAPCMEPPQPGCTPYPDAAPDDAIQLTIAVPDGWTAPEGSYLVSADSGIEAPDGAWVIIGRGAWLLTDPCQNAGGEPDMPVGPTVDDFANALAAHPLLDVTTPVDVALGGYSGKYMDLQVPADYSGCDYYRPWEPGVYAQGWSNQWHLWIIDVEGTRWVVQSMDFAGTAQENRDELRAMVESIQIQTQP